MTQQFLNVLINVINGLIVITSNIIIFNVEIRHILVNFFYDKCESYSIEQGGTNLSLLSDIRAKLSKDRENKFIIK